MKDLSQSAILTVCGIILLLSAYNLIKDKQEMDHHKGFFKEMIEFKDRGGRNTSEMGLELCHRLNILEFHLKEDVELTDCDAIYNENNN